MRRPNMLSPRSKSSTTEPRSRARSPTRSPITPPSARSSSAAGRSVQWTSISAGSAPLCRRTALSRSRVFGRDHRPSGRGRRLARQQTPRRRRDATAGPDRTRRFVHPPGRHRSGRCNSCGLRSAWRDRRFIRLRFEWNSLSTRSNAHCKVVAATRYAPASFRGVSALTRATGFGRVANYGQRAHEEICLLVQVETQEALDHLEEVAGVEGIDGVFIGPRGSRG